MKTYKEIFESTFAKSDEITEGYKNGSLTNDLEYEFKGFKYDESLSKGNDELNLSITLGDDSKDTTTVFDFEVEGLVNDKDMYAYSSIVIDWSHNKKKEEWEIDNVDILHEEFVIDEKEVTDSGLKKIVGKFYKDFESDLGSDMDLNLKTLKGFVKDLYKGLSK